ncbi:hypothetical protein BU24DRAFT_6490 [Aaosphaeria arxii CBS 175.79]|uniref:Uncharacterized protein n=1 Tax=Aaosphaeria arxii CBS 175.79 TaxID=1450172 RepID=A0A6A5Y7A3_9PLEO|nr:uncharacterized protein BU24DRAFT_6490 [Aaosphaeria arxii CBS 175.79]KAF2020680.1 hypothetical protein BU24DRAFT_6490 [Aaosphaeria arxii CBS 175.79]
MDSTSRLYERLGQIPQDPSDPESLEDLIVCAFGAFERYYVCWKTRGGEFRQDGYDLPIQLQQWLYPEDGTTRDFPSLQVVFGRGNEYFASDKNGKMEYKEPPEAAKKSSTSINSSTLGDVEKPMPLRRSRTISYVRPLSISESITRPFDYDTAGMDTPTGTRDSSNKRTSSATSSASSSRPPSQVFSRPTSDPISRPYSPSLADTNSTQASSRRSSYISLSTPSATNTSFSSRPRAESSPTTTMAAIETASPKDYTPTTITTTTSDPSFPSSLSSQSRLVRRARPLSISFNPSPFPKIVEGKRLSAARSTADGGQPQDQKQDKDHIPCHCDSCITHRKSPNNNESDFNDQTTAMNVRKVAYASTGTQTDPEPPRRYVNTSVSTASFSGSPSLWNDDSNSTNHSNAPPYYDEDNYSDMSTLHPQPPPPNPVFMGRMFDYFSRPGYQLGDSLVSSYEYHPEPEYQQEPVIYYNEEDVIEYQRRDENDWTTMTMIDGSGQQGKGGYVES